VRISQVVASHGFSVLIMVNLPFYHNRERIVRKSLG
jgi:hypothetical protein